MKNIAKKDELVKIIKTMLDINTVINELDLNNVNISKNQGGNGINIVTKENLEGSSAKE